MWKEASWLGVPRAEIEEKQIYQGDMNGRFALYRLKIELEEPAELVMDTGSGSMNGRCYPVHAAAVRTGIIMTPWMRAVT